ncbi:hypothetical protein [Streptomyces sp. A5-4]|uniref:hypothetical protein n=1 Tax=Streptomyces sp. A5-4 TaxID=3384771 RepID=UPI003DA90024
MITLGEDARPLWRIVRRYARILGETLPEQQAVFIERTAEQTLRGAACLAASECSETITENMLSAACTLVRRSVQDTVRITKGADAPKVKRQPLSLTDKVRAPIEMHGGRATSSQVLPYVGASASEVKALPDIVATVERSGTTGRPATVFTVRDDHSRHTPPTVEPRPAERTEMESSGAKVVQLHAYRPEPKNVPAPVKRSPVPGPVLAPADNPFRALL